MATKNVPQELVDGTDDYSDVVEGNDTVIDFGNVEDSNLLPAGEVVGSVVTATPGTSKKGEPKIDLRIKIEDAISDFGEAKVVGRSLFETLSFSPNALSITKQRLVGLGLPPTFRGSIADIAEAILHSTAQFTIGVEPSTAIDPATNEPYPPRNRIKRIKRYDANDGL